MFYSSSTKVPMFSKQSLQVFGFHLCKGEWNNALPIFNGKVPEWCTPVFLADESYDSYHSTCVYLTNEPLVQQ